MTTVKAGDDLEDAGSIVEDAVVRERSIEPSDMEALLPSPAKAVSASNQAQEASLRVQLFALLIWMIK